MLHYFSYTAERGAQGLHNDCVEIHVYDRKAFYEALPVSRPFIVQSRINRKLIKRLNADNNPILLEGLHCSGIIPFLDNMQRIVLRMHNDEAAYYHHLAQTERRFLKRLYFIQESRLLKTYQQSLAKKIKLACLSQTDADTFEKQYGFEKPAFVPCFIPWQKLTIENGLGSYCLYHGNMAVSENEEAALWLVRNVFSKNKAAFIIAGKGISKEVESEASGYRNITLVNNPSIERIDDLIRNAQVNVLPSMNGTGVKLKLLNALLNGRHCITNEAGAKGSGIHTSLTIAHGANDWLHSVAICMQQVFDEAQKEERKTVLTLYNNAANAERLNALW